MQSNAREMGGNWRIKGDAVILRDEVVFSVRVQEKSRSSNSLQTEPNEALLNDGTTRPFRP